MSINILDIFDLIPPLGLGTLEGLTITDFSNFYEEAEELITLAQNRGGEVLNLYDIIIATIDASLLSDGKGVKTWFDNAYQQGRKIADSDNELYYPKAVSFVGELQSLVLDRYDSLDEFYEVTGIAVSQVFADLSEAAGYPVSPQYIEDIS